MKISGTHLKRYRQIAGLLWKYGRSDLAQQMSTEAGFGADETTPGYGKPLKDGPPPAVGHASPEQLADDLEAMGPTYGKLGQVHRAALRDGRAVVVKVQRPLTTRGRAGESFLSPTRIFRIDDLHRMRRNENRRIYGLISVQTGIG